MYTFDEYVALEQTEGIRYEYWDGEVINELSNRSVRAQCRLLEIPGYRGPDAIINLPFLDISLSLQEIYEGIVFPVD